MNKEQKKPQTLSNENNCQGNKQNSEKKESKVYLKEEKTFDKKTFFSYLITFLVALVIAFLIANYSGIFNNLTKQRIFAVLSDACFVPGALFVCFSLLLKIASGDFFDSISFIFKRVFNSFIPGARIRKEQNYVEYKRAKQEKRKKRNFTPMLIVGLFYTLLAVIFLIFYYNTLG